MITQNFNGGSSAAVEFLDTGAVQFIDGYGPAIVALSAEQFHEFMPLALLVYHRSMPMAGCAQPGGWSEIGSVSKPAKKKPGRPKKVATAKRTRKA